MFIYNTNIGEYNFPMIKINKEEQIDLIKKFDYTINTMTFDNSQPYFVINNAQSFPDEIREKYLYASYPLSDNNILLLYEYKSKFHNGEKDFLNYLENKINEIKNKQLERIVFNNFIK